MYMSVQKQEPVSTIRVSNKLKSRLAVTKARLTIKEGRERSMEELIELLLDTYDKAQQKESKK
jgi:hypothetical protein